MFNENDEEYQKRKERARQLRNSVGFITSDDKENMKQNLNQNNMLTSIDNNYIEELNKIRKLRNSVGFITSNDQMIDEQQNNPIIQNTIDQPVEANGIDLSKYPDLEVGDSVEKTVIGSNKKDIAGVQQYVYPELEREAQKANIPTVQEENLRAVNQQTKSGFSIANQENKNITKITNTQIEALEKAQKKNKNIAKGGVEKFNEFADSILNSIMSGFGMKPVAGLYNTLTTIAGFGVRGLEGATSILGFEKTSQKLNDIYNSIVESGSNLKEQAYYTSTVNNQVDDDFIRTSANVTDIVSNVAGNAFIGYVTGISGTAIQGVSVGGSSAQEVLDENKDNIAQASLTGIAKGYVSYLTEKMFDANILTRGGKKTSVEKFINRMISNNINSKFGKEVANRLIGIVGENVEELAEDNAGYLIDKLVNNKDIPSFQEWWNNTTETAKMTTISTIVLGLLGLGGGKFEDIEKDMETEYWIDQAQQIIEKEDLAIHFNTDEIKNMNNTQDFYITKFKQDGEIENLVPTRGKEINNSNSNLNIAPAIVKDIQTNYYNVIDANTGVVLDSTLYSTTIEAENGFNEKVNQLSDLQVRDINNKIGKANYTITNKLIETINQAKNQINNNQNLSNTDNMNSETNTSINNTLKNTLEMIGQIQDRSIYKNEQANNIFKSISNDLDAINYISQSGNNYLNSLDKNGKVVYQQKLNKKLYTGSDVKNTIYNAIANADIPNRIQTTAEQNADNLNVEPTTYIANNQTGLKMEDRTLQNVSSKKVKPYQMEYPEVADEIQEMAWNFQEDLANSIEGKRYKAGDKWTGQKRSTTKELAEIKDETGASWDKISQALEDIANNKGNYALAKKIELVLDRALTEGYRNIYGQTIFPNESYLDKKSKIEGKDYKNTETDYDVTKYMSNEELRPFGEKANKKGQFDVEDNQVRNTKKSNSMDNIKENTSDIIKSIEKFEKAKNNIDRQDIINIANALDVYHKNNQTFLDKKMNELSGQNAKPKINIVTEYFKGYKNKTELRKLAGEYALKEYKNKSIIIKDIKSSIDFSQKGLKKTFNIKQSNETLQTAPILSKIVQESIYVNSSIDLEDNNFVYHYFYSPVKVNKKNAISMITIKEIVTDKNSNPKFYYHDIREINNEELLHAIPQQELSKMLFEETPNINNSIPQKEQNVKNETAINKKSMQKEKNNTSNDDIRSMKKNKTENKSNPIKINSDGEAKYIDENQKEHDIYFRFDLEGEFRGKDHKSGISMWEESVIDLINDNYESDYDENDNYIEKNPLLEKYGVTQEEYNDMSLEEALKVKMKIGLDMGYVTDGASVFDLSKYGIDFFRSYETTHNYLESPEVHFFTGEVTGEGVDGENVVIPDKILLKTSSKDVEKIYDDLNEFEWDLEDRGLSEYEINEKVNEEFTKRLVELINKKISNKNRASNDDIRYMKKTSQKVEYDSQGRQLSRQQQEFFKDSKIRDENGRLLELYHGSNSEFTVFDLEKSGQASTESKVGFWFTESEKGAKKFADSVWYGDKKPTIYKTYLDIKNPKIFEQANTKEQKTINNEKIKELKKELRKFNEKYEYADTSFSRLKTLYSYASFGDSTPQSRLEYFIKHGFSEVKAKQIIEEVESYNKVNEQIKNLEKENDNLGYDDAYEQFKTMLYSYSGQTASEANMGGIGMMLKDYSAIEKMRNDLIAQGYDGIIIKNTKYDVSNFEGENNQYVAFYPEQIKNVTNTNPTSNDDIRYMKNNNNQKQSNEAKRTIRPEKGKTNIEREDSFIEQEIQQLEKTNNFDPNIPMTKISDIVKDIEKYLKSRILTKYIDYRSYGIYKVNRDIIRVQEKSDLDTILHEMAHMLDNRLHLQKENLALELLTKDVWKLYGKYPESIQLEEGFAEVVRQYYIQPEKAKNKYPDTIKFIEDLRKSDQAFDNFSSKLQQDIYNYIHQTENNRAKSRMSAKEIKERQSLKEMKDTVIDRTITALWDEDYKLQKYTDRLAKIAGFQDIYQVPNSENPVVANRLKKGIANAIDDMLKHGIIDKQTGKRVTRGLSEIDTILENEDIADFSTYLLSLRSIEAFEKGKKTGIRYNDAKAVVEKGNKNSNFLKAKEIIQEYNDGLLEYAKEGGILSDKQIDTIKKYWLNYVPMFRVQENISNQNQKNNGNPLKRFIGSDRDIINPLEGIITNTINIVSQVNKNTVIKQFYDLGEYAGLTDEVYDILTTPPVKKVATATLEMFKKELEKQGVDTSTLDLEVIYDIYYPDERDRPNELITSFKVDGERKYIHFFDKDLYKIFTNINARELNGLEKIINFANSIFKAGTTGVNLAFAIPNMISDSQQAYVMSEAKFLPIYSSAKGVYDTVVAQLKANGMIKNTDKNTELELMYSIYLQSGASQAGRISRYRKDLEQQLIEIYKKSYKDFGMKKNQLKEFEKAAKYVCELSEEATRFENFILELQKAIKEGKSPQEAIATAAINTRNLTIDFAVKGELSKVINVVVPYFSAKMAGIYNAYGKVQKTKSNAKASYQKTMAEQIQSANDVQRAKKEARKMSVKSVRKPILTLLSLIAFNMIRKAFTDDDDKVKELNDQKKYDNYVFSDPFNDNEVITIKKPQGVLRDIINTAEFLQDLVSGNIEEGKAGEKFVELIKAIAENNSGTDTVGGLIPPFIKVPVELGVNKDFYYNSEIVKENDLKNLKPKDQYYEYNTTASIGLGQVFNVSPAKIDFSIRGLFGQAAFDLWSGFSSVIDLISGNEKADLGASNKYLLKRFFANPDNNSNSLNEFYDKLNELNVKDNYNELTKEEKTQYENMKIASSSISKINKQIKEIKADDNLSGDEKGEKIIELQNQRTDTARQALGKSLIDTSNTTKIETTKFYPSRSTLTNNGYSLVMTTEMQKEYSQIASDKYNQYAKQGIYSDEYLEKLETKCKDYAKNYMMNKYKSQLTKSK